MAFDNSSLHIRSTKKELLKEYLLPLLVEFAILSACIMAFALVMDRGPLLEEVSLVGDEISKPTAGRLAYGIFALVMWFIFTYTASKEAGKGKDYTPAFLGFAAGILLWQFVGEISWHYSIDGIHFVPLENMTVFITACLFAMLLIYGKRHSSFDWGVWCMLLSFSFNWFGHYVMTGTYPFVGAWVNQSTWYIATAILSGVSCFFYSIFLLFKANNRRERIMASMYTYISIGLLFFGIMEG